MNPYDGEIGWEPVVNSTLQPLSNVVRQEPDGKPPSHDTEIADEADQN